MRELSRRVVSALAAAVTLGAVGLHAGAPVRTVAALALLLPLQVMAAVRLPVGQRRLWLPLAAASGCVELGPLGSGSAAAGWVASASLLAGAVLVLVTVRRLAGSAVRWVTALVDAGAVALVAGLPRWWESGRAGQGANPRPDRALALAAVLAVLLVLFVAVQTSGCSRQPRRTQTLLVAGLSALAVQAVTLLGSGGDPLGGGLWQDALPLGAAAAWLGVLLRPPAVAAPTASYAPSTGPVWRIGLVSLLGGAAPASLLVGSAPLGTADVIPVVVSCVLLAACSLAHLTWRARLLAGVLGERTDAMHRADALVEAGRCLLQAGDGAAAGRAAVRAAVQLLAGAGGHAAAALALGPPDLLELVAVHSVGLPAHSAAGLYLEQLEVGDRDRLRQGLAVLRPIVTPGPGPGDAVLMLPLRARDDLGTLLLAGPAEALERARPTLESFALQVAQTLAALPPAAGDGSDRRPAAGTQRRPQDRSSRGVVQDIARGLREHQFTCHYQPIMDITEGTVAGFEALARWEHPGRGLLLPGVFLPTVRDAGLLTELDNLLLVQACRAAMRMDPRPDGPYMSVNLSVGQLADEQFALYVHGALAATGLVPWRLQLEVTEAASLQQPEVAARILRRLRERRVRVAFDDFGTGHSSLSWLQQLPLDVVKIDKSFVDRLPLPAGERPVVAAVTALSHVLGLSVVAEGVETLEQQHELIAMGVHHAQGWLYAKALPRESAQAFCERSRPGGDRRGPLAPSSTR